MHGLAKTIFAKQLIVQINMRKLDMAYLTSIIVISENRKLILKHMSITVIFINY